MYQLASLDFDKWLNHVSPADAQVKRLFIVASGYEQRSTYWTQKVAGVVGPSITDEWCVLGFTDHKNDLSRLENDSAYRGFGLSIQEFASHERGGVVACALDAVGRLRERFPLSELEIHVDYSSMPRLWYCSLFTEIQKLLGPLGRLYFWYSAGVYDGVEYPTAGVSDVQVFSGRPSLHSSNRTHIFGLGFDRIRSSAIFRVLDPPSLVCFYADPGIRPAYVKRVLDDNRDVIAAARLVFTAPIDDFALAFGRITGIAREFAVVGDVILVPDGPKPLVLASSLVPDFLDRAGVVSLHVRGRRIGQAGTLDVRPAGDIYGLSVRGAASIGERIS